VLVVFGSFSLFICLLYLVLKDRQQYVLLGDELYYRTIDGVLLKCLGDDEAKSLMGEIHEGVCGAHQSAFKMKWMIRRNGYYWPTILKDCFKYFTACQGCQKIEENPRRWHTL